MRRAVSWHRPPGGPITVWVGPSVNVLVFDGRPLFELKKFVPCHGTNGLSLIRRRAHDGIVPQQGHARPETLPDDRGM